MNPAVISMIPAAVFFRRTMHTDRAWQHAVFIFGY
jgi:hypothetical protein